MTKEILMIALYVSALGVLGYAAWLMVKYHRELREVQQFARRQQLLLGKMATPSSDVIRYDNYKGRVMAMHGEIGRMPVTSLVKEYPEDPEDPEAAEREARELVEILRRNVI